MFLWAQHSGVKLHFIQPGKPTQNAFVESYNGKFRDACLNEHWFVTITDARRHIEVWRIHYNTIRPHSSLGNQTPAMFRQTRQEGGGSQRSKEEKGSSAILGVPNSDNSINSSLL